MIKKLKQFLKTKGHKDILSFSQRFKKFFSSGEKFFLFLFLIFLPTQLGKHFWPKSSFLWGLKIDYLSPTVYLTDIFLIFALTLKAANSKKNFLKVNKKIFTSICLLSGGFFLINFLLCLNKVAFFIRFARFLEIFALILLVKNEKDFILRKISCLFIPIWSISQAVIAWTQTIKQGSVGGFFWLLGERSFTISTPGIAKTQILNHFVLRPYGTFSHPNSLAGFLLICIIIQTCLARNGSARKNAFFWASLFSALITLFLTLSKTAIFVLLGYFAFVLIEKFKASSDSKKTKILIFSSLLTILILCYFKTVGFLRIDFPDSSIRNRVLLARAAGSMVFHSPFFGVGLNNFILKLPEFWPEEKISLLWLQPVHNIYFLLLSELGIIGTVLVFYLIKRLIPFRESPFCLKIAIFIILITGLFDHYWLTLQQNFLLLGIILGLA